MYIIVIVYTAYICTYLYVHCIYSIYLVQAYPIAESLDLGLEP